MDNALSCKKPELMMNPMSTPHTKAVVCIKFNPNGKILATASADKKAHIYDSITGEIVKVFQEHSLGLNGCEWLNEKFLITCSDDKLVKVWDIDHEKCIASLTGHKSFVYSIAVHPFTDVIISGSYDGSVRIMDIRARTNTIHFEAHTKPITSVSCSVDGGTILTSSFDGFARLWDLNPANLCPCISSSYDPDFTPIPCASYSPNGKYSLIGGLNSTLGLYSLHINKLSGLSEFSDTCVRSFTGHENNKYSIVSKIYTINDKSCVVSGSEDNNVYIWDINGVSSNTSASSGNYSTVLKGHQDAVLSLDYNPQLQLLATGSRNGSVAFHSFAPSQIPSTEASVLASTSSATTDDNEDDQQQLMMSIS